MAVKEVVIGLRGLPAQQEKPENPWVSEKVVAGDGFGYGIFGLFAFVVEKRVTADSRLPGLHPEPLPLMPWLREICAYLAVELESVRFNLRAVEVSDTFTAYLDPRQMGRAVSNLLCNAARYAHAQVDLSIECADNLILLHVDDDGPGIPETARERVFEPFMRLDESRNRESGGFGLGLAIVQRIVEWHGGHASVSQSPLGGARFTLQWAGLAPPGMIHACRSMGHPG
jgi:signal transduction histidine kinase